MQRAGLVIQRGQEIHEGELKVRQRQIVGRQRGQPLKLPDEIVAKKADRAAEERRQAFGPGDPGASHQRGEGSEGIPVLHGGPVSRPQFVPMIFSREHEVGIAPHERVPGDCVAALAAFQQERGPVRQDDPAVQLEEVLSRRRKGECERLRVRLDQEPCAGGTDHAHGCITRRKDGPVRGSGSRESA